MVPWRATEDGFVSRDVLDWYARFADGQPGVIVVEATGIRDVPSGPLLRIGHDRFIPGLAELAATVHRHSGGRTRLFIQIIDFLRIKRRPPRDRYLSQFLVITDAHRRNLAEQLADDLWREATEAEVRRKLLTLDDELLDATLDRREIEALRWGFRERVTDVEHAHIRELPAVLPGLFADAAERAQKAGFDGVELHYAHAYTMASFLSARNTRTDGYGGPREQRIRLPLEVFAAARARVGARYALGCRFLCDEVIEGGNRVDDATYFGVEFARAGIGFPLPVDRRQIRGLEATEGGRGGLSLHRPERLRVHAHRPLRRARAIREAGIQAGPHPRGRAGRGPRHPHRGRRRDWHLRDGRGHPRAR
ncbi:MAG: hypothetical protein QM820_61575 [Minicystis sp.]